MKQINDLKLAKIILSIQDELREELAEFAHETWSGWMKYLFGKSRTYPGGSVLIPADLVDRWKRQMVTAYKDLPEEQKESDRVEADKILTIIKRIGSKK